MRIRIIFDRFNPHTIRRAEPLTALYPVFVVLLAPALLHESIKPVHGLGIACAVIGGMLLSAESAPVR